MTTDACDIVTVGITQLLKQFIARKACPRCTAQAMIDVGAVLSTQLNGAEATARLLEETAVEVRNKLTEISH